MLLKPLVLAAIIAALPPTAQAWEYSLERGVDLYRTAGGDISVSLVCDPRSVYGTSVSAVLIRVRSNLDVTADVTFRFPDKILVQVAMVHGHIAKAGNEGGAWETLIAGFRAHSAVEITMGEQSYNVTLGEPMPFSCI